MTKEKFHEDAGEISKCTTFLEIVLKTLNARLIVAATL
jgi:hypothetical protein